MYTHRLHASASVVGPIPFVSVCNRNANTVSDTNKLRAQHNCVVKKDIGYYPHLRPYGDPHNHTRYTGYNTDAADIRARLHALTILRQHHMLH